MFHYKEIDDDIKAHLFKLIAKPLDDVKIAVEKEKRYDFDNVYPRFVIGWNIPAQVFVFYDLLLPEHKQKVDKIVRKTLKSIDDKFDEVIKDTDFEGEKFDLEIYPAIQLAIQSGRYEVKFDDKMRKIIGKKYQSINSYANVKQINQIKDPKERSKAIEKMSKDITHLLKQIA
jgi:hypothetical protein